MKYYFVWIVISMFGICLRFKRLSYFTSREDLLQIKLHAVLNHIPMKGEHKINTLQGQKKACFLLQVWGFF